MNPPRRFPFGPWAPDLPPLALQEGLLRCENVVPVPGGYRPVGSISPVAGGFSLPAAPSAALRGVLSAGTLVTLAGTGAGIHRLLETGWVDVSRPGGYVDSAAEAWDADQFGSAFFFVRRGEPVQAIDVESDATFFDLVDAPRAGVVATAEGFLWLGDLVSRQLGVARDAVAWSAVGAPFTWPTPGTDAATSVLSGEQRLEGSGGIVQAIVSGAEVVAIFQEDAIHRADFVGNDIVWQINRVETEHGLAIKGAAVAYERAVFFISRDGFRIFNYTSSKNIGKGIVNEFFFADWDPDFPDQVRVRRDPEDTKIFVSYPAKGNDGVPNRILSWDWMLDRWSLLSPGGHYVLMPFGLTPPSLDSPDTPEDPDRIGGVASDTDPPGDESFDTRDPASARLELGCFDASLRLSTFTGAALPAVLETGDLELSPGRRSLLNSVRPQVDGEETSVQVAGLDRRAEEVAEIGYGRISPMDADGKCSVRVDARYHRIRFLLPRLLSDAVAFDVEARPTGRR